MHFLNYPTEKKKEKFQCNFGLLNYEVLYGCPGEFREGQSVEVIHFISSIWLVPAFRPLTFQCLNFPVSMMSFLFTLCSFIGFLFSLIRLLRWPLEGLLPVAPRGHSFSFPISIALVVSFLWTNSCTGHTSCGALLAQGIKPPILSVFSKAFPS